MGLIVNERDSLINQFRERLEVGFTHVCVNYILVTFWQDVRMPILVMLKIFYYSIYPCIMHANK